MQIHDSQLGDTHDLSRVSSLRSMLLSEMRYLRSRSVFTNLSIDANDDATAHELLSRQLKQYFTAFKRRDKETAKFIQAASYTSSFYHFLLQKRILASDTPLSFHVVGYTDRAMNAMTLKRAQLPLLKTCAAIYQQHHSDEEIDGARREVIGTIERAANRSFQHVGEQQQLFVEDIIALMERSPEDQILVYIQDKQRLAELITTITQRRGEFVRGTHYQEIHANISEKHKREIQESQDRVQVIFMTASASRGLSFKRAKHILVDIPHFAIEQNLMEILQVIYRGRGGDFDQDEKTLTFYLADRIAYPEQADRELALKESLLHLLNVMLILKTAIMTRIEGSGPLGLNQRFRMIPIGGKSVLSAGETFSKRLSDLLKELQTLANQTWSNKKILNFMINSLRSILSQSHIQLVRTTNDGGPYLQSPRSYLEQLPTFATDFTLAAQRGFDHLLKLPLLEPAYLSGGLLIVPIIHKSMRELYRASIEEALKRPRPKDLPDVLTCMELISRDTNYPESLRASLSDAILLVKELRQLSDTKNAFYEQESRHEDQHYAFPLFTFLSYQHLRTYFETEAEAEEQDPIPFRELLSSYIGALYPADGFLPIGRVYAIPQKLDRQIR